MLPSTRHPLRIGRDGSCRKPQLRSGLQDFCSRRAPRPRPPRSLCRPPRASSPASTAILPTCAGDAAGLTVGGEGAANGAGATAGAGFVAAEPAEASLRFVGQRFLRTHATPLWLSLWPFAAKPVIRYAQRDSTRRPGLAQLMGRRPTKAAALALANKTTPNRVGADRVHRQFRRTTT